MTMDYDNAKMTTGIVGAKLSQSVLGSEDANQARKVTPADNVVGTAERLNVRLSNVVGGLSDLRDRISGSLPEGADGSEAETQFALGGFVGSVGQSLERSHRLMAQAEDLLAQLAGVI